MKLRATFALLLPLAFAVSVHASSDAEATPTPGLIDKTLEILHLKHAPGPKNAAPLHHGLELQIGLTPDPVQLSQNREIKVTVAVYNRSKKFVHLDFPTSQRIEILIRDASGKAVTTWSEDQSFTSDPATVTINPGERLEYDATVATREMTAGKPYVIEASFPIEPDLTVQQRVIPQK